MKTKQTDSTDKPHRKLAKKTNHALRYSGLAFQMVIMIAIGVWIGQKLDQKYSQERPVFTAIGALLFLVLFFIRFIYEINQEK